MNTKTLIFVIVLGSLFSGIVHAQFVIEPAIHGNVGRQFFSSYKVTCDWYYKWYTSTRENWWIDNADVFARHAHRLSSYPISYISFIYFVHKTSTTNHAILEFPLNETISGAELPLSWMTSNNWTAKLDDLTVENAINPGAYQVMDLFKMNDDSADGILELNDYYYSYYQFLEHLYLNVPQEGYEFNSIEITDILKNDLFPQKKDYIGFIICPDGHSGGVGFSLPRIYISPIGTIPPTLTPTPTPTLTPLPTSTPSPVATLSPVPVPLPDFLIDLDISQSVYCSGDSFDLNLNVFNSDSCTFEDQGLFVMLDVFGDYYFYPQWDHEINYLIVEILSGDTIFHLIDFIWPDMPGKVFGLRIYAAIVEPGTWKLNGNWDNVDFGWI
ncbi:hypothetical protein K8T06_07365 [bacterium]|nr:hypothetical protein [bacterium]